jgi:septal ring factor EnvC (AmiA/AmiB activator)
MATYDERIAALEKDAATMRRDIIYKLDDTNSAVTMIRGVIGNQGRDVRDIKSEVRDIRSEVRTVNVRLEGIDTRLDGFKEEIRAIKDQQDKQGQDITDIKRHLATFEERVEERFTSVEGMLAQILQRLTNPPTTDK